MFSILVNRTTAHINTSTIREGADEFTMNRCGAVTRGNLAQTGKAIETAADALKAAKLSRSKVCKNCVKVVEALILADEQAAAEAAAQVETEQAAPVATAYRAWGTETLPASVTMDAATRVLSGQIKDMLDLYNRGLAKLTDDGDLVLQ